MSDFVHNLAKLIASFPPAAVAAAKRSVLAGCPDPVPGLITEEYEYRHVRSRPIVAERMKRIQQLGFGSREAELGDITEIYEGLAATRPR